MGREVARLGGNQARTGGAPRKQVRHTISISPRMQKWLDGELVAEDFDDEEVNRMQLRDKNGHFSGRPTKNIPRELAIAFRSQQQVRLMAWFAEMVPQAQQAYREILVARHLQPGDGAKLKAAEGIFERVIGKVQANSEVHMTVTQEKNYEDVLEGVLVDVEEED